MIPARDQLPRSWRGLKNLDFKLPLLVPNSPLTCPRTEQEILEYLDVEAPGGSQSGSENVISFELKFIRTALANTSKYWIWGFRTDEGLDCYVAVRLDENGDSVLGFEESFGLTPEQWLVMDYYEDWENEE